MLGRHILLVWMVSFNIFFRSVWRLQDISYIRSVRSKLWRLKYLPLVVPHILLVYDMSVCWSFEGGGGRNKLLAEPLVPGSRIIAAAAAAAVLQVRSADTIAALPLFLFCCVVKRRLSAKLGTLRRFRVVLIANTNCVDGIIPVGHCVRNLAVFINM
jgi:hypothetical protein